MIIINNVTDQINIKKEGKIMNRQTINKIVKASGIQEGELVLLHFWGEQEQEDVLEEFAEAVVAAGASP